MSSIGVFREGEIDGKPFHMYTFSSQTHNSSSPSSFSGEATIDSESDNALSLPQPQPLFLCPSTRLKIEKLKRKENGYSSNDEVLPFSTSPHFPNIRSVDQQVQHLFDPHSHSHICKLPLVPLSWGSKKYFGGYVNPDCSCGTPCIRGTSCYLCPTCDQVFHKECVEAPLEIKHPSWPFLSLQLYSPPRNTNYYSDDSSGVYSIHDIVYHCPTYNLTLHPITAMKSIPILIDHLKRHPHSLTFFPKQNSLLCNVCGVINAIGPTYVCARCVFVVHQDCIYSPYVIRISRHQHRISFTYSLPSGALSCGVCRKKVDNDCGAYSCNKCDDYFVHTRCALRGDLWDGIELEGVPEEPEIVVDPFEQIADGIILHFSHGHHLNLEISRVYDDDKFCQACVLPIYEGNYYSCVDQCCDFILHEACAYSPLKKHNPLYPRSLTLKVVTNGYNGKKGHFRCVACQRQSCGFAYEDPTNDFRLDLRCALISEPVKYEGHKHPLFLSLTLEEEKSATCQICHGINDYYYWERKLNCIECDFVICYKCATLPYKAMYKHDKHLLTFREGKEASDESGWCEVCERKMVYSREKGFYSCDDYCCTTLHVDCLLGSNPYIKPGQTIGIDRDEFRILRNNTMSRPFCDGPKCVEDRCLYRIVFKKEQVLPSFFGFEDKDTFCSYYCAITADE